MELQLLKERLNRVTASVDQLLYYSNVELTADIREELLAIANQSEVALAKLANLQSDTIQLNLGFTYE